MAEVIRAEYPGGGVLAVQPGAAGVPGIRAGDDHPDRRRRQTHCGVLCFGHRRGDSGSWTVTGGSRSRSCGRTAGCCPRNRWCISRSAPCCPVRRPARWVPRRSPRRAGYRSVLTCDGGGTSTDVAVITDAQAQPDHRGVGRPVPRQDPDDRHRHRRRRRRVGRLGLRGGRAQGRPAVGRRRPRPGLLRARRHRTNRDRRASGAGPDPAAPARRRDPAGRRGRDDRGRRSSPPNAGSDRSQACAAGILEISAWNQANALRRITTKRGLDVRDYPMVTFGGSGSLLACPLMDILDITGGAGPAEPRQRLGLRPAHRRRAERLRAHRGRCRIAGLNLARTRRESTRNSTEQAREALLREGFRRRRAGRRAVRRPAVPRAGVRGPGGLPAGRDRPAVGRRRGRDVPRRPPGAVRVRLSRQGRPAGRVGQPAGHRGRADSPTGDPRDRRPAPAIRSRQHGSPGRCTSANGPTRQIIDRAETGCGGTHRRAGGAAGIRFDGPGASRDSGRTSTGSATCSSPGATTDASIRFCWRSSPGPWPRSRPRWRRRSAAPRGRR